MGMAGTGGSPGYALLVESIRYFTILYPMASGLAGMVAALFFCVRWERPMRKAARSDGQLVSVLVYARNDASCIERALLAARRLAYPHFEIVVFDDGSSDATVERVAPFVQAGQVRLIAKAASEGRAMALNDAIPCLSGEILLLVDASIELAPGFLKAVLPHFQAPRVAAVAGNARVRQPATLLGLYHLLECTALHNLAQRAWRVIGRGYVLPGMPLACRRSALQDVGYFNPLSDSDEAEVTWRLQKRSWDLRFEPGAIAWMPAPAGLLALLRQRLDWAIGWLQVLAWHRDILHGRRYRRLWPLYVAACLSELWALAFWISMLTWLVPLLKARYPLPGEAFPGLWGMAMGTVAMAQAGLGLWIDRPYDPGLRGCGRYLVLFPVLHWLIHSTVRLIALPVAAARYAGRLCNRRAVRRQRPPRGAIPPG